MSFRFPQFYLYSYLYAHVHARTSCVCVHLILYNFIMGRFMYLPPQSRYRTISSPQGFLMLPLYNHTKFPPSLYPQLVSTNHKYFTHFYNFIISKHLNKCNYIVHNLLGLDFFTRHTGDCLGC